MLVRAILADWAAATGLRRVQEGDFDQGKIEELNSQGYSIYFLPNYPSEYDASKTVDGSHIDKFEYVYVDMDLKDGVYTDKDSFIAAIDIAPTRIVDSGNGVHVYWKVSDLDPMSFLRLQRRLMRRYKTDEAICKIYQLMRLPGTINVKKEDNFRLCETLFEDNIAYSCEQLDKLLTPISVADENYCQQHWEKTYNTDRKSLTVTDKLPDCFGALLRKSKEAADIWSGNVEDRSAADYRLGHLMYRDGFSKEDMLSVLINTAKALPRAPVHRMSYAENIVDKVRSSSPPPPISAPKNTQITSSSVKDILARGEEAVSGTRFPCSRLLDDTIAGFRLGQVIGLVAGSGVGKTSMAVNMFKWFTELNPDYDHLFVSLEQTDTDIAARWRTVCQGDTRLHDKVHVLSNYNQDGSFRNLSLDEIKAYILDFKRTSGKKFGTVVIDHIGVLRGTTKNGENQSLIEICKHMKEFAVSTNTMVVMQSQAPREKAGIGDLEMNKDAAYGTVAFESFVDYLLCIWQPLKRMYKEGAPTVMAFKFCKIRYKKQTRDNIQEDVCYQLFFDPETEQLRELTQNEEKACEFYQNRCINARKADRKTDLVPYVSRRPDGESKERPQQGDDMSAADPSNAGEPEDLGRATKQGRSSVPRRH